MFVKIARKVGVGDMFLNRVCLMDVSGRNFQISVICRQSNTCTNVARQVNRLNTRFSEFGGKRKRMCGRFALAELPGLLLEFLGFDVPLPAPRYNITPTQPVLAVVNDRRGGGVAAQALHWGLVPFWARDRKMAARMINARAETAAEKPAFRAALRYRRCLVPASGFYEWKREGRAKIPHYFSPSVPGDALVMAGLWEDWEFGGEYLRSLAILTVDANSDMAPVHDRMPVILPPEAWAGWLDADTQRVDAVLPLLCPAPAGKLRCRRVGAAVNSVFAAGEDLVDPV